MASGLTKAASEANFLRGCAFGHLLLASPSSDCRVGFAKAGKQGAHMAKRRRWTVVFVPHGSEPSKIVEVSYGVIKVALGGVALGLAAALLIGYATMARSYDLSRTARLKAENSRLTETIGELHGRLTTLADTISRISQRDA